MKLTELKEMGKRHPNILVRFLDGALGLAEPEYSDPVIVMVPKERKKNRKIPLYKLTCVGQGMLTENNFEKPKDRK